MVKRGVRVLKRKNNAFIIWVIVILAALVVLGIILSSREPQFSPSPSPVGSISPSPSCSSAQTCELIKSLSTTLREGQIISLRDGGKIYSNDYFVIPAANGCGRVLKLGRIVNSTSGSGEISSDKVEAREVSSGVIYNGVITRDGEGWFVIDGLYYFFSYRGTYIEDTWVAVRWPASRRAQPTEIFTNCISEGNGCIDSDRGLNFSTYGVTRLLKPMLVNGTIATSVTEFFDACPTSPLNNSLSEYSCGVNITTGLYFANLTRYLCPYGCENGACKPAPVQPATCASSQTCTEIDRLASIGKRTILRELDPVPRTEYVVLPSDSNRCGLLLKASAIANYSGISDDKVELTDVFTGTVYKAVITIDGLATIAIGNKVFIANYSGTSSSDINKVSLEWAPRTTREEFNCTSAVSWRNVSF